MINQYNQLLFEILAAAYCYYHLNRTLMTDNEYDAKVHEILLNIQAVKNNKLLNLIDLEQLKTSTTLYYIKDYPQGLKRICLKWLVLL